MQVDGTDNWQYFQIELFPSFDDIDQQLDEVSKDWETTKEDHRTDHREIENF